MIFIYSKVKGQVLAIIAGPFPNYFEAITYADINNVDLNTYQSENPEETLNVFVGKRHRDDTTLSRAMGL